MEDYKEKLDNFKNRVSTANTTTQLQEVRKLDTKQQAEVQLNVWIPKTMLHTLKLKSVNDDKSIKQLVQGAIEKYLAIVP